MRIKVITLSLMVALASQLSSGCCNWRPFQGGACGSSCYQARPLIPPILNRPILNPQLFTPAGPPAMNYNSFAGPQLPAPAPTAYAQGFGGPTPGCTDCGANRETTPMPGPNFPPQDFAPQNNFSPNDYGYPNDHGQAPQNEYPGDQHAYPAGFGSNYQHGGEPTMEGDRRVIASTPMMDSYPPPTNYPTPAPQGTFQGSPLPLLPAPREMPQEKEPMN